MGANVAARLNGVEQALACILVTLVDVTVLTKPRAHFCLASQNIQILGVKNFYLVTSIASGRKRRDDLADRLLDSKLSLEKVTTTSRHLSI
jgi:hypothetical protein